MAYVGFLCYILLALLILFMENVPTAHEDLRDMESGREVFVRLANNRVNKVLSGLEVLKKLASRKSAYTQKDVSLMKKHLHAAVDEVMESFNPSSSSSRKNFSLDI